MRISIERLQDYVDVDIPVSELASRLTMAGLEVDEVHDVGTWGEVFVGLIERVSPHPHAADDHMRICTVSTGGTIFQAVCDASNVDEGQKVGLALPGAFIFNPDTGKREKFATKRIRGVESQARICSARELQTGDDISRILVLPDDAPLGGALGDYLRDTVLILDLPANRGDCQSWLGVAREIAAVTGGSVREPGASYVEGGSSILEQVDIAIACPDLCSRYTAAIIAGVSVGKSPPWLSKQLILAGFQSINNVVDATNYVMSVYNQPTHAFDFDRVAGAKVTVRLAEAGEILTALNGSEYTLDTNNLVISDARKPIALAGIVGGADTEIGPGTTTVLLESATFDPINNRQTAQSLGLKTEATARFEKGLQPELAEIALRRAAALIQEVAGGQVAPGIIDIFPARPSTAPVVRMAATRLNRVLGMDINPGQIRTAFDALGLSYESTNDELFEVKVPYWRSDLNIEEDLIEEVVRITGYDAVPSTMPAGAIPPHHPSQPLALREQLRDLLVSAGMQETISYSLTAKEDLERVLGQLDEDHPSLKIVKPLSRRHEYLRTTLQAGLLNTLAFNRGHSDRPVHLFEVGRVFSSQGSGLPEESEVAAGVISGLRRDSTWLEQAGPVDFYDAKGVVEEILERLGVNAVYETGLHPTYHPGRCAAVMSSGQDILGYLGEIHPTVQGHLGLDGAVVVGFELYLAPLMAAMPGSDRQFATLQRFPAATRDQTLVAPAEVPSSRVASLIKGHPLVEAAELSSVYTGGDIPHDRKSLTFSISFRHSERTLTREEVELARSDILSTLEREANATPRT